MIENGARKTKQGSLVREGLMIESVTFRYDVDRYGETVEKLITTTQFVVPVVVTKRILRSRAKFDCPWSVVGVADVDPELVDIGQLTAWLATAAAASGSATGGRKRAATTGGSTSRRCSSCRTQLEGGVRQSESGAAWRGMAGRGLAWLGAAWRGEAGNVSRHVAASRRQFRRTAPRDLPV